MASPKSEARELSPRNIARRLSRLTEAQAVAGWGVILVLAALLGAIYLNQASRIAAIGRHIQIQQGELEELKRINGDVEREIAEAQSLERLQQEAIRLGFQPAQPEEIEYIIIPGYPLEEAAPEEPTLITEAPTIPATMWEALLLALRAGGNRLIQGSANEQ
jgi:hypothetical protein